MTWVRRQQARPPTVGISNTIALPGQVPAGYIRLIRRPRVEMGVRRALGDGTLAFEAHERIAGIGFWIAPDRQRNGLATRQLHSYLKLDGNHTYASDVESCHRLLTQQRATAPLQDRRGAPRRGRTSPASRRM